MLRDEELSLDEGECAALRSGRGASTVVGPLLTAVDKRAAEDRRVGIEPASDVEIPFSFAFSRRS